ncbi:MAG: peptide ABC transporter substrate-binding protein, partial [Deltaproteobacteria bacterium]|nr:peptide ABC transporter substrate-binding protein [Deltaproteobacteria bacterium]
RRSRCHYAVLLVAAAAAPGCSDGASSAMSRCSTVNAEAHFGTTKRVGKPLTTFYVNAGNEPEYLDPGLASDSASDTLVDDLFEGLFVAHPETQRPMQGMAVSWAKSDDNRIYRFHLRPEARWSDGQPVVAGDFVYAWQRVATAATGARMAAFMYVLKNGKLYHQGRLRVTRQAVRMREAPGQEAGRSLEAGTAVRLLKTSPVRPQVSPASLPPAPGTAFTYRKKAGKRPATLTPSSTQEPAPTKPVQIVGVGREVTCNEAPDRLYELKLGGARGYLPGCALKEDRKGAKWAFVVPHDRELPTFRPAVTDGPPSVEDPPQKPGAVPLDALTLDPSVLGVRAVGNHILEVELEQPTPYFIELCSSATLFPVRRDVIERFEKQGRPDLWYRPENIVTNGPYTLDEWKFRYEITFKRNPHYYDHDKLKIHRIVWLEVGDYHASLNLYRTGELDYIGANLSLPQTLMSTLARHRDFSRADYLATYWYEFNVLKPPVDDVRVRRALNLGLDKQLLIDTVTRGGQLPAHHYVPDQTGSGYDVQVAADQRAGRDPFSGPGNVFDPERGRALLAEAGYPVVQESDGWRATGLPALELLYNTSQGHRDIALAVQAMWREYLGVTTQLRNEEWKVMIKNVRDGHFQVARYGWVADYSHPHSWMETFLSDSANNPSRWSDPAFDALLRRAAATADEQASIQLYRQAEAMAVAAMPKLPVYFYTKSTLVKPYVKGFYKAPMNTHPIRWMWLDPNWCDGDQQNKPAYAPRELPKPGRIAP